MTDVIESAESRLRHALNAAHSVDRDELPDEIVNDIDRAIIALLKARGHCEAELSEVPAQ